MNPKPPNRVRSFERAVETAKSEKYVLRLYVAGASLKANQAIRGIKDFCEEHLKGRYELEVVDIYQQPVLAKGEQIIATPTLVKRLPSPLRRFIGDMVNTERILVGLDLVKKEEGKTLRKPSATGRD